jgi:hypothetical protein
MKKFALLLLLPILFWGCEKTYDSVINPKQTSTIQVTNIAAIDSIDYLTSDSVLTFAITFNSTEQVHSAYCNIVKPDGTQLNSSAINLYNDGDISAHGDSSAGDNTFSNKFTMSNSYNNGVYIIKYYVEDIYGTTDYISAQNYVFDNGKDQFAPVLSDLNLADSVALGAIFIFNVTASDSNGLNDIENVSFALYRPDSTLAGTFQMHDDGDLAVWGDSTAGDGIYSYRNSFSPTAQTGYWRFEFQAIDYSNLLSNKIIKNLKVTQ